MKSKALILMGLLSFLLPVFVLAQTNSVSSPKKVEVYYFHFEKRCATCNAVESVSKETVLPYGEKVVFTSVNLDETSGAAIGKKMNVDSQTLLLVCGAERVDLTNEAFLNARSKPEKLKKAIQVKLDRLLK